MYSIQNRRNKKDEKDSGFNIVKKSEKKSYSLSIILPVFNVEKYLEFIGEKTKNVSKENVDEFENTLKELDLIVKV